MTFGTFDALVPDPSSIFVPDVSAQLNKVPGVEHEVFLAGCHKPFRDELLRPLKCIVADEKLLYLSQGTKNATLFKLSEGLRPGVAAARLPRYKPGDFILWDPRETPRDHLEIKLSPSWLGPLGGQVIEQVKNDIECVHLNLGTKRVFHIRRLKSFFGSRHDAVDMAKLDRNQIFIVSFIANCNHFSDAPYNLDLANSIQFDEYVNSKKAVLPLRYSTKKDATTAMGSLNKLAISDVSPGESVFLDLRFFYGATWGSTEPSMWFDKLNLPMLFRPIV